MNPRAQQLISALQLQPHPEGGWFAEVFRSVEQVQPQDERPLRSALTSIYFLLESSQQSNWHRVRSDEVWVHLEGDALNLWSWDGHAPAAACRVLGPVDLVSGQRPQRTISAGHWQAARPAATGVGHGYTLVACMVGPGFDFADFSLLQAGSVEAEVLHQISL
jgi:predicted cupin superfamily sugar epimerase